MRSSTLPLSVAFLILSVAHLVHSHSSGAQNESCDSLTVTHTHLGAPVTGSPCDQDPCESHKLRVIGSDADTFIYNCSERYQLQLTLDRTVTGNSGESLNGYMVAPREDTGTLGADVPYVGSWVLQGADQKHVCGNQAVTQSRVLVDTVSIDMTWRAPSEGIRNVSFWFVVVPSTAFYYLPVKSLTATANPATCVSDLACSRVCQNGGTLNTGDCTCNCTDGFSGANCENCVRTCQNGGTLDSGSCTCMCPGSFSGDDCGVCSLSCVNGGILNASSCTCDCPPIYTGTRCESLELAIVVGPAVGGVVVIGLTILIIIIVIVMWWRFRAVCCKSAKSDANPKHWQDVPMRPNPAYSGVTQSATIGDEKKE